MQEKDIDKLFSKYHEALYKAYKLDNYKQLKYYINEFPEEVRNLIEDINIKVDDILASYPNNIEALHLKVNIMQHYDDEQVKIVAKKVLEIIDNKLILNSGDLSLYYKKLVILEDIDRNNEAKKLARNILKLCGQRLKQDKDNIEIMQIQAQMCGKLHLYRKKRIIIKKILKINPSNQLMRFELNFVNDDIKQSDEKIMVVIVFIALLFVIWLYYMLATQQY